MSDGSLWRIALLSLLLVAPAASAGAPSAELSTPSSTVGQEITDIALDPTGQYAIAVVNVDTGASTSGTGSGIIPTGLPGAPAPTENKHDVYTCDFGSPSAPSRQACRGGNNGAQPPTGTTSTRQSVAVTSFPTSGGLTARYAIGGPAAHVAMWSTTETAPRTGWQAAAVPPQTTADGTSATQDVLNVSISPDGNRLYAATAAGIGTPRLVAFDASAVFQWEYNLTNADRQKTGFRVNAMDFARNGKFLAIGLTPNSGTSGTLLVVNALAGRPTTIDSTQPTKLEGGVTSLEVSDDGNAIVVGTTTGFYYFPVLDGVLQQPYYGEPSAEGTSRVALTLDGELFALASGREIHFYRHINTSSVAAFVGKYDTGSTVGAMSYDKTGRLLVAVAGDRVYGFSASRAQPMWSFDATTSAAGALDGPLRGVEVSEGGDRIFVAGRTKVMPYATSTAATLAIVGEATVAAIPATTQMFAFRITNTGSLADEFSFHVTRPVGWNGLNPDAVALLPDGSSVVNLTVEVPAGHAPGTFSLDVQMRSSALANASRPSQVGELTRVSLVVGRSVSLVITPNEERFNLPSSGDKEVAFTIRNLGNAGGLVNLTVDQVLNRGSRWTIRLSSEQVAIDAGGEATVQMTIERPRDGLSGDKNLITLRAREGAYEATRNVTAFVNAEFGAELIPLSNETIEFIGRQAQTISVAILNRGNTDDVFNVTAIVGGAASSDWTITVHAPQVNVPRSGNRSVGITISPNVAEPRAASLTIRALSQGSLEGTESSVVLNLVAKEVIPTPPEDNGIPTLGPMLVLAVLGVAAIARRRLNGGPR